MTSAEIDEYIGAQREPKRKTLQTVRETIREIIPDAEECISYKMPGFRLRGKVIAGIAAFKNHLSYFPHSGAVVPQIEADLAGYTHNNSTLQFPIDQPLPKPLVEKLIAVRMRQAFPAEEG